MPEMIVIAVIALIIFGPRRLPELGKSLGKSIAEFKRASNDLKNTLEEEIRSEELGKPASRPRFSRPPHGPTAGAPLHPRSRHPRRAPSRVWIPA